jgi:hypothetical protein
MAALPLGSHLEGGCPPFLPGVEDLPERNGLHKAGSAGGLNFRCYDRPGRFLIPFIHFLRQTDGAREDDREQDAPHKDSCRTASLVHFISRPSLSTRLYL